MSTTYQEFAAFAEQLARQSTEIDWRNSVSRTYYAAYHQALSVSDRCPEIPTGSVGMHQQLINRFKYQGTKDARTIAAALSAMKRLRSVADYELQNVVLQGQAQQQISDYKEFSRRIVAFGRSNSPKSEE